MGRGGEDRAKTTSRSRSDPNIPNSPSQAPEDSRAAQRPVHRAVSPTPHAGITHPNGSQHAVACAAHPASYCSSILALI